MIPGPVVVFGGSGFLGRYIVSELAKTGVSIKIVSRYPDANNYLKTAGRVGQIISVAGNVRNFKSIEQAVKGAGSVVNLVGVPFEKGKQTFSQLHANSAENIAKAAKAAGVKRLVHFSALGV